ncbi:MAG TPA: hypothetical protein PK413_10260 [Thermoanaerobaculia bacterium]|nr:hypothetical protein [Thermoanaerobaculia bacterium]
MSKLSLRVATVLVLALVSTGAAFAQHWTAVGSTGVVDESNLATYAANGVEIGYLAASTSTSPIVIRYNVTNTFDNGASPNKPGWTNFEAGGFDPGPLGQFSASVIQVDPCTGVQTVLCTATSTDTNSCPRCQITAGFDFSVKLYYIQVTLSRSSTTVNPTIRTLRLF